MRKTLLALLALFMGALTANADSLVTARPTGTDLIDWSQLGPALSAIPAIFYFTTTDGVTGSGSYANPASSFKYVGTAGEVMQNFNGLNVNFGHSDYANWTQNSGPLTLNFSQGYSQAGAQVQTDFQGAFTAQICDINGCFTENGMTVSGGNNGAIYIGIDSVSPINWVTFSLTQSTYFGTGDFMINQVTLDAPESATPEPSSFLFLGTGLVGFAGALRRKFAR